MDDSNQDNIWTVYVHINKKNFKCYVGVTSKSPEKRWLNGIGYKNQLFYNAIKKYGWDGFYHEIVASGITKEEAENFEKILIDKLDSLINKNGYNVAVGGIGGYRYDEMVPVYQFDIYGNFIKEYKTQYSLDNPNNIFFTTSSLRDYHYLKQKNNAYYHIQAINLPFQNIEFFYVDCKEEIK